MDRADETREMTRREKERRKDDEEGEKKVSIAYVPAQRNVYFILPGSSPMERKRKRRREAITRVPIMIGMLENADSSPLAATRPT